jgi:hypothetical protein
MKYHGSSAYQFYMALKHMDEGTTPDFTHGNSNWEHLSVKTDMYIAWLGRICLELVEGLPTSFRLESQKSTFKKLF